MRCMCGHGANQHVKVGSGANEHYPCQQCTCSDYVPDTTAQPPRRS